MRRSKTLKRGRWVSILLAGLVGFLLGDWHATASRPTGLSASQNVAIRFPEAKADAVVADAAADTPTHSIAATTIATGAMVLGDAQLALLNPNPMVPLVQRPAAAPAQAAVPEEAAPVPTPAPKALAAPRAAQPRSESKSAPDSGTRHASRAGFLLNDAQIASIKVRLHLTPDQEQMWPAVEAALRNVAYAKAREAHRRSVGNSEVASLDAESTEVQGLKSAAIPLLMSFNDEQKNEVRSLAHVMGLDRLAAEF